MRGIIDKVWENESRNGQKYVTVEIDGERYSVWDQQYFGDLRQGARIEYDVQESGNFKHLSDIEPLGDGQRPAPYNGTPKDRQITRLSCLKSASEIAAPLPMDLDDKEHLVIDLARRFERYVFEEDGFPPEPEPGERNERRR